MNKNSLLNKIRNQNGQALLIVVLVMVVALTVGLSIASKSITSFRSSTEQASSQKALSAAEAGIEQALKTNVSIGVDSPIKLGDANYQTTVNQVDGTTFLLDGGNPVMQSSGIDLWLTTYPKDNPNDPTKFYQPPYYPGSFSVYWGDSSGECNNAALEVVLMSGSKNSPIMSRYAFDPCPDRQGNNHFTTPDSGTTVAGRTFAYRATITATNGLIARIVPLYYSAIIGIIGTDAFPSQGTVITSVGSSGTSERRVNVYQGYPELPVEYYLYNLFLP
jgi:hypothetical protein